MESDRSASEGSQQEETEGTLKKARISIFDHLKRSPRKGKLQRGANSLSKKGGSEKDKSKHNLHQKRF